MQSKMRGVFVLGLMGLCLALGWSEPGNAGTAVLTWDPYAAPADFKEFRFYRANQNCSAAGPLQPLAATLPKPASGPLPTSYTDTTVPNIDGTVCYEQTSVDTAGNESLRSNRASKVVNLDPPPVPQNLQVQSVSQ